MPNVPPHWLHPADLKAGRRAQDEMAGAVRAEDEPDLPRLIGGADISCQRFDTLRRIFAALVVHGADGAPRDTATHATRARFPYVPGFLAFREVPALVAAWDSLAHKPDILLVDGHGIAHPRGVGVATHLGLVLDVPTIGVAKTILVGAPDAPLGEEEGACVTLVWKGNRIGMALRTRRGAGPVYVSVGHRVSLARAVALVRDSVAGRRLPAPIRAAHDAANSLRRAVLAAEDAAR